MSPAESLFFAALLFVLRVAKEKETATARTMIIHGENSGIEGDGVNVGVGVRANVEVGVGRNGDVGVWVGFVVVVGGGERVEVGASVAVEVGIGVGIGVAVGVGVGEVVGVGVGVVVAVGVGVGVATVTLTTLDMAELDVASPGQTTLNWYVAASVKAMSRMYMPLVIVSNVCLYRKPEASFAHWRVMFGGEVFGIERVPFSLKKPPGTTVVVFAAKLKAGVVKELKA